jgi:hypothetical protein
MERRAQCSPERGRAVGLCPSGRRALSARDRAAGSCLVGGARAAVNKSARAVEPPSGVVASPPARGFRFVRVRKGIFDIFWYIDQYLRDNFVSTLNSNCNFTSIFKLCDLLL